MSASVNRTYAPGNLRWFNRLLILVYGTYLRAMYRIRVVNAGVFDELKPPYVIVPNHLCMLDPFMVGIHVPVPVHWIASDGNMRTSFMRALLSLVGTIPKSKSIPDLQTVNGIMEVVRRRKGVVGLFPEGAASFDGHTQPMVPATGKLLKILGVPVVTPVLKGAFYSLPRWSWTRRRGILEIEFKVALTSEDVKRLSSGEIMARLGDSLGHDEALWAEKERIPFSGRMHRAENLETALFQCPSCETVGRMRSRADVIRCESCGEENRLDGHYRFQSANGRPSRFGTIREWSLWQESAFRSYLLKRASVEVRDPVFSDSGVLVLKGWKLSPMRRICRGIMSMYRDRIEIAPREGGSPLVFLLSNLEGEGVLKRNLLEFYSGRSVFQIRFPTRSSSARQWMMAISVLRMPNLEGMGKGFAACQEGIHAKGYQQVDSA